MEVVRNGKTTTKEGVRNFADGIQRAMRVTKVPVALAGGGQKAVLTILMDISDAKRTEQELRRARDEAISANQTKSEFLARMSHEFRTPLNAILGFSDILANRRIGNLTTERVADYSNDIKVSAELLLELVNDLLDIAAIEEGRVNLAHERIDIPVIVDESLRTIDVKSADKGIILNVEVADGVTPLLADRRALKQILLNLLTNAVKFTPPGGSICLSVSRSAGATDFIVSDTGVGIDADVLADLMRPAAMLAANTYRTEEGWGLGLTIVRALAELHGGRIAIVSKFGQGTTVTVTLPNTPTTHDAINDDEAQG
jgi:signal transduction histidine kinase